MGVGVGFMVVAVAVGLSQVVCVRPGRRRVGIYAGGARREDVWGAGGGAAAGAALLKGAIFSVTPRGEARRGEARRGCDARDATRAPHGSVACQAAENSWFT